MFDWQTILVILAVFGALLYTGLRAWKRINAFRLSRSNSVCETGCGSCQSSTSQKQPAVKRTVLVDLTRTSSARSSHLK
jgi:hypothetical protein